jgi:hypothetical protein
VVGAYVAATIVTLVQYLRLRDKRLLPLMALFAFEAQALGREWFDAWKDVFQGAACLAGLVMLMLLTMRPVAGAAVAAVASPPRHESQPGRAAEPTAANDVSRAPGTRDEK